MFINKERNVEVQAFFIYYAMSTGKYARTPGKSALSALTNVFLGMTKMQRCIILFIIVNAVHVSSCVSAHHQELKSVHAASGICQDSGNSKQV
jgi:hypothetical protein